MSRIDEMVQKAYPINENMDLSYRMADAGLQRAYRQGANAVLSEIEKCLESDHSEDCHFTIYQNIIETIKKLKGE